MKKSLLITTLFFFSILYSVNVNAYNKYADGKIKKCTTTEYVSVSEDSIYLTVDEMPKFINGGDSGLIKYIARNIEFPEDAIEDQIEAKVYVTFLINDKGKVGDVKVVESVATKLTNDGKIVECNSDSCEKEAVRVIKSLPDFIAGKMDGKPVNVMCVIPIYFKLS